MRRYADSEITPLYPFGYGLSYTKFEYNDLAISRTVMRGNESLTVQAKITNVGDWDGEEIVQLYICDEAASVTRPVKELKGFDKIRLRSGESQTVVFEISAH
jgi:beta-glucosidase